ncbi:hypothetical protein [Pandoraea oxalativorans]|uniref:Uncharacterized protein n=1 Tax=Pandoraea oxalativorans TaxID=573737 RepID=A0A0G3IFQ3_9BURK|nr:hypothetical protein [Pandoraea oxalativorans]AKK24736.1 hypothetical protein MB84_28425 [Pandoraea oxalativorans]
MDNLSVYLAGQPSRPHSPTQRHLPLTLKDRHAGTIGDQEWIAARTRGGDAALGAWPTRVWERLLQWLNWSDRRSAKLACRDIYQAESDREKLAKFMDLRDLVVPADRARFTCEFRGTQVRLAIVDSPLTVELEWAATICLPGR